MLPAVSCMCLTYGRVNLLEEAVHSFLLQDYKGEKELLILNDYADQELVFNHPQVKIINIPKKFRTLGEKRNACAALCSYDHLAVWDDDDIYLPRRLSFSIESMAEKRHFRPTTAFILDSGAPCIKSIMSSLFNSGSMYHRSLFDQVRGYAHMGSGLDIEIEGKFKEILPNSDTIKPSDIYYLYRWHGSDSFHLSAFGRDTQGQKTGAQKAAEYIQKQKEKGLIKTGRVLLDPKWKNDYMELVEEYLSKHQL